MCKRVTCLFMVIVICLNLASFNVNADIPDIQYNATNTIFNEQIYSVFSENEEYVAVDQVMKFDLTYVPPVIIKMDEPPAQVITPRHNMTEEDVQLIALVTMAEAEGECEEGKRLVIDTILNRIDSEHFPDSAYDVIYQPNQFTSMWNGRADRCSIQEDICELVKQELTTRTNTEVVFFTAGGYGHYGSPLLSVENHYFSSY